MIRRIFSTFLLSLSNSLLFAQFPPQAPLPGSTAIPASDNLIVGWANSCTVKRGWENISDTTLGKTTSGNDSSALGPNDLQTVSLGDGGTAIVSFAYPLKDGSGADFAIFENGFTNPLNGYEAYLELAFVSVSSDGEHYVTFPATSLTQDTAQIDNFTYMDARLIHNLAGKYSTGYGTPFDLSELADSPGIDIQNIRYVKIIDVVGSIDSTYASYDKNGHMINDPFPSPYPTGGFDLNAVAALHWQGPTAIHSVKRMFTVTLFPKPANGFIYLKTNAPKPVKYQIYDIAGRNLQNGLIFKKGKINLFKMAPGLYFIRCQFANHRQQSFVFSKQ